MKIRIDKQQNIVRMLIAEVAIEESDEVAEGVVCDYDIDHNIVGLEFLNASATFGDLDVMQERVQRPRSSEAKSSEEEISKYELITN